MAKVVGIDLGTTFSAIAELDDLGNPEVLSDPETGNRITRSAVFFGKDTDLSEMSHKILNGSNENEVSFVVKNPKKSGFFEKFFQLFS